MLTLPKNLKLVSKLKGPKLPRRVVRHHTTGCGVINLTPGPGVTVRMIDHAGFQGDVHHTRTRRQKTILRRGWIKTAPGRLTIFIQGSTLNIPYSRMKREALESSILGRTAAAPL